MTFVWNQFGKQIYQCLVHSNPITDSRAPPILCRSSYRWFASKSGKNPFPQYVNLPPASPFAGKGSNFETTIKRKRVIQDPNLPSLDSIGELKWATTRMLRDARRRRVFVDYYPFRQCYYNMRKCKTLPNSIREEAFRVEQQLPRDSKYHLLTNRCALTGRSRGVLKRYRLSRLCWRNLADYNKLSGVIKACWS